MSILAKDLKPGDDVILVVSDATVKEIKKLCYTNPNQAIYVTFTNGYGLTFSGDHAFPRQVINLVDKKDRDGMGRPGTVPYQVLVFATDHEYKTTNDEADFKKRIIAQVRYYDVALKLARLLALDTANYAYVILR